MIFNTLIKTFTLSKAEKKELEEFYKNYPKAVVFVENGKVCFSQKYKKEDQTPGLFFTGHIYGALAEILKVLVDNRQMEVEILVSRYC